MKKNLPIVLLIFLSLIFSFTACDSSQNKQTVIPDNNTNAVNPPPEGQILPTEYSALECYAKIEEKLASEKFYKFNFKSDIVAKAGIKVNQEAITECIKNDNYYIVKDSSISLFKKVAEQKLLLGDDVYRQKATFDDKNPVYNSKIEHINKDNFLKTYGVMPTKSTKFLINFNSVVSSSVKASEDNLFVVELELDKDIATVNLKKEMMYMADTDESPMYKENVKIAFFIDYSFKLYKIEFSEKYHITGVLGKAVVKCASLANTIFDYSSSAFDVDISAFNEFI